MSFKSGTVALVGRPNAGKSTLLNALVGARIAAVSKRPQTTRTRLVGVYTTDDVQVVLVDTPGIHAAWTPLNQRMVEHASQALVDVDVACWILDAVALVEAHEAGRAVLDETLREVRAKLVGHPLVVALNKIDAVDKRALLPVMAALAELEAPIVPISAVKSQGLAELVAEWAKHLVERPPIYPLDHLTDTLERDICAELVREQIFELCEEEVPYATAVEIERFDEAHRAEGNVHVHARIVCEKASQKGILIGKGGAMIKRIGIQARRRIEELLDCHVRLDLFVAVEPDWTRKPARWKGFGVE